MPEIITLAVCEIVVVAKDETSTLVNLLTEINLGGLPEIAQENAAIPFKWHVYALWEIPENEKRRSWEQRVRLRNNRGETVRLEHIAAFDRQGPGLEKPLHVMVAGLNGFPIIANGEYQIEVSVREVGTENWTNLRTYPLRISR